MRSHVSGTSFTGFKCTGAGWFLSPVHGDSYNTLFHTLTFMEGNKSEGYDVTQVSQGLSLEGFLGAELRPGCGCLGVNFDSSPISCPILVQPLSLLPLPPE